MAEEPLPREETGGRLDLTRFKGKHLLVRSTTLKGAPGQEKTLHLEVEALEPRLARKKQEIWFRLKEAMSDVDLRQRLFEEYNGIIGEKLRITVPVGAQWKRLVAKKFWHYGREGPVSQGYILKGLPKGTEKSPFPF
jgi:hypothetical protein